MKIDKLIAIAEKQEELLRFPRFSREDAWKLGNGAAGIILKNGYPLSVSIRLISGLVVFQYMAEGTTADNEGWMTKKFNTVRDLEESTLLCTLRLVKRKETLESRGLDPRSYVWGGGGFPIRIKDSGLIAVFTVSGLPHLEDHAVLVDACAAFLGETNAPRFPSGVKL
ncbi:MAG: heme-binding protein [Treponema sp.]|jgi:uncharacterized protein (UPF0303 family)|nr:heme-binding protein [Treponema sp.]